MKVSELCDAKLDYWVAKAEKMFNPRIWKFEEGERCVTQKMSVSDIYSPSSDWSQGGPIIERYGIDTVVVVESAYGDDLLGATRAWSAERDGWAEYWGKTPLEAAMRCFVSSKFGEDVPDE